MLSNICEEKLIKKIEKVVTKCSICLRKVDSITYVHQIGSLNKKTLSVFLPYCLPYSLNPFFLTHSLLLHSLTHSLTLLTHSLSLTHSLTHSLTLLNHSLTLTHSLTHSLTSFLPSLLFFCLILFSVLLYSHPIYKPQCLPPHIKTWIFKIIALIFFNLYFISSVHQGPLSVDGGNVWATAAKLAEPTRVKQVKSSKTSTGKRTPGK